MLQSNISGAHLQGSHDSAPDVSIVIVSWNVRELLAQCLEILVAGTATGSLTFEIIVIDNASHDGSADLAATYEGVRIVRSARNLGYGRANNAGLKLARGQHLLVLNCDTLPCEGSIERLVVFQRAHSRAGIVSPRLLNADGSVQASAFRFPTLAMAALDLFPLPNLVPGRIRQKVYNSRLNGRYPMSSEGLEPFKIDHPLGACLLLSRDAYTEVGAFDPGLFMYSEEINLAIRYKEQGWECWQVPTAEVIHLGGQSTRQAPDRMYVELWRSRLYVYNKHYSLLSRVALRILLVAGQIWSVLHVLLRRAVGKEDGAAVTRRLSRAGKVISLVFKP